MSREDLKEFASFLESNLSPPPDVERRVCATIQEYLSPSIPKAVSKLFALNAVGSIATLALCPQYGLTFTGSHGLMHYMMQVHPAFCFFVCGILWMIGGQALSNMLLTWDERRVLSHYYWGAGFGFVLFSVLSFACFGSLTLDLWLLFWAVGALVVVGAFDLRIRHRLHRFQGSLCLPH